MCERNFLPFLRFILSSLSVENLKRERKSAALDLRGGGVLPPLFSGSFRKMWKASRARSSLYLSFLCLVFLVRLENADLYRRSLPFSLASSLSLSLSRRARAQGMGNIFAVEPKQLYTESPTSDKYAKVGLGGIPGALLALGILAGVFFGVKTLGSFEEVNNEFAGYDGESVSYYSDKFSA